MPDGLEVALRHAALGREVFPFRLMRAQGGKFKKTPLVRWQDETLGATADEETIRAWWRRWPDARPGWRLPDGRIVVDIDDWEAFEAQGIELPDAPKQRTPSGGWHLLYLGDARQTVRAVPGMDTRVGGKGWVGLYDIDSFLGDPPPLPAALTEALARPEPAEDEGGEAIGRRSEILELAGRMRWAGSGREAIAQELLARLRDGRIESLDEADPWTERHMLQIAADIGGKPTPEHQALGGLGMGSLAQPAGGVVVRAAPGGSVRVEPLPPGESPIVSMADYIAGIPDSPSWLVEDLLVFGDVNLIAGQPKAGKSTLVAAVVGAMGADLAGFAVAECPVLLLTEEQGVPVRMKYRAVAWRMDVMDSASAFSAGLGFRQSLAEAARWARERGRCMVVIDTLSVWAKAENENDASEMTLALTNVREAFQDTEAAVVLVHHARKGGGDAGEGIRGSGAIAAAVGQILELRYKVATDRRDRRRRLDVLGRYGMPDAYTLAMDESGVYSRVEEGADAQEQAVNEMGLLSEAFGAEWFKPSEAVDVLQVTRQTCVKRCAALAGQGLLEQAVQQRAGPEGGRRGVIYRVTDAGRAHADMPISGALS